MQEPARLVIWEAQYGDFINGAQVDHRRVRRLGARQVGSAAVARAAAAARHEGQGPDHASARPERFLQLAADINMRVANCTTAAQYFHLLRRQAALLLVDPLPLVVLTPKSLLRHPFVASAPRELAEGRFRMVIAGRTRRETRADEIRRVIVCSGKVYVDLMASRAARRSGRESPICRLEQLYPVPMRDLRAAIEALSERRRSRLGAGRAGEHGRVGVRAAAPGGGLAAAATVRRVARPRSASPAEGSAARHAQHQQIARRPGVRRSPRRRAEPSRRRESTRASAADDA